MHGSLVEQTVCMKRCDMTIATADRAAWCGGRNGALQVLCPSRDPPHGSRCGTRPADPRIPFRMRSTLRNFRRALAKDASAVANRLAPVREAEFLASEVLPLLDGCRWLERRAEKILSVRRPRRGRPLWLIGHRTEVRRQPYGTVLVIAAGNYPLFLPGVQTLQALAAGNRVLWKPAPGGEPHAVLMRERLLKAGLDSVRLTVLDTSVEAAEHAIEADADLVVFTGSNATGRAVLKRCAEAERGPIPAIVELSGCDAVFVCGSCTAKDLKLAADAVAWGLRLNGSRTCMAPRRVLVDPAVAEAFLPRMADAAPADAELRYGDLAFAEDVFRPVCSVLIGERSGAEALLELDAVSPFGLTATVFGPPDADDVRHVLDVLPARVGTVNHNDLIANTADPRTPFAGARASGFGPTRGPEGLLAMTRPVVVNRRRGRFRPHYRPPKPGDAKTFATALRWLHVR